MKKNLISVLQLCVENNVVVEFNSDFFVIKGHATHRPLLNGKHENGLYLLSGASKVVETSTYSALLNSFVSIDIWHARLGHASADVQSRLF